MKAENRTPGSVYSIGHALSLLVFVYSHPIVQMSSEVRKHNAFVISKILPENRYLDTFSQKFIFK